jgi:hypothetical protein
VSNPSSQVKDLLKALLEVMDNLERALETAERDEPGAAAATVEGVRGIHRQLTDLLFRYEVRAFNSVGKPFDPRRHEAMAQIGSDTLPPNHVASEIRRGYHLGDRLFRPAQVFVSRPEAGVPSPSSRRPTQTTRPHAQVAATRPQPQVAPTRPAWVLNPPADSAATVYLVGRSRGAQSIDASTAEAVDAAFPALVAKIAGGWPDHPACDGYTALARILERRSQSGLWDALCVELPDANNWVEDTYWERLKSDVRGTVYDAAVLLAIPRRHIEALLAAHGDPERWGGLGLLSPGPIFASILGEERLGALVAGLHAGGLGTRSGLEPGDVIVKVTNRLTPDAPTARRLLTLYSNSKPFFDVLLVRDLGQPMTLRVEGRRSRRR